MLLIPFSLPTSFILVFTLHGPVATFLSPFSTPVLLSKFLETSQIICQYQLYNLLSVHVPYKSIQVYFLPCHILVNLSFFRRDATSRLLRVLNASWQMWQWQRFNQFRIIEIWRISKPISLIRLNALRFGLEHRWRFEPNQFPVILSKTQWYIRKPSLSLDQGRIVQSRNSFFYFVSLL